MRIFNIFRISSLKTLMQWTKCVPLCCVLYLSNQRNRVLELWYIIIYLWTLKKLNLRAYTPSSNTELIRPIILQHNEVHYGWQYWTVEEHNRPWIGGRPGKWVTLQHCTAQTSNHIGYRPIRFLLLVSLIVIGCVEFNPGPDHVRSVIQSNEHLYMYIGFVGNIIQLREMKKRQIIV